MKFSISIVLLLIIPKVIAQNIDPVGADGKILNYEQFHISYNEKHEQPNWVSYTLTKDELELESRDRISKFKADENVRSGTSTHNEYTNTGYDRGHISRAEFNKASELSYEQSFLMSNVCPQIGVNFNRTGGDWYNLEELEMKITENLGSIYCVSGPIFKDNIDVIGDTTAVTVPGYFFKTFLNTDQSQAIAFVLKHDNIDDESLWLAAVSVDQLEGMTGFNFWAFLDNKVESKIEKEVDLEYWKLIVR